MRFVGISAVFAGVADLKKLFAEARRAARAGQRTLLFVDEIHRFNRAQQDGFLPYVEDGTVVLVGATTENPSFELNAALLSRAQVLIVRRLDAAALGTLLARAEAAEGRALPLTPDARDGADRSRPTATGASCSTRPRHCSRSTSTPRSRPRACATCSTAASRSTTRTATGITI